MNPATTSAFEIATANAVGGQAPTQVFASRLAARPEAVWAQVQHSRFVADCLGAALPPLFWSAGQQVAGTDASGQPLRITVAEADAPASLVLELCRAGLSSRLALSICPVAQGSRLMLLHEACGQPTAATAAVDERRYQQRPWRAAARRFEAQRRITLAALARWDAAWLARAVLFCGQPSTGADMLAALLAHDHEHRVEMAALWPPAPA